MTVQRSSGAARKRVVALALLLCALLPAWPLAESAGQPSIADLTEMSLEELMAIDIVYGASRHEQKVTQAPSSVSIITAEEIRRYGYQTLGDILESVRGFWVRDDRNYSYVGVRGFGRLGDYNTRILLVVDGHRVNEDLYEGMYVGTEQPFDVEMIDRVEIIRGPGSSLYGTNALFAVVNIVTRRGGPLAGCEVSARAGSHSTLSQRLTCGHALPKGDWLFSGSRYGSEGQDLYFPEFDDPALGDGVARGRDGDRYSRLFGSARLGRLMIQASHASRDKRVSTASYGTVFDAPHEHTIDSHTWVDFDYSRPIGQNLDFNQRVYYDRYYYHGVYRFDYPPPTTFKDYTWSYWAGAETRLVARPSEEHTISAGIEYRTHPRQVFLSCDVRPYYAYLDEEHSSWDGGLYVQEEYRPGEHVTLNVGLRHDRYSSFGGTTNPRAALIISPNAATSIKTIFGSAYRAPSAYELYYTDGASFKKPEGLGPEKIRSWEIVVERYWGESLRMTGAWFRNEVKDLISLQTDPSDGLLFFTNTDRVVSNGVEFEMERRWRGGFAVKLAHTWQESTDRETRDTLTNSPRNLSKLNFAFPIAGSAIAGGLELQCEGSRRTLMGERAAGFCLTNLTLLSGRLPMGLELSASGYNLFNKTYAEPGSDEFVQDQIEQNGRTARLDVTIRF